MSAYFGNGHNDVFYLTWKNVYASYNEHIVDSAEYFCGADPHEQSEPFMYLISQVPNRKRGRASMVSDARANSPRSPSLQGVTSGFTFSTMKWSLQK